MKSGRSILAVAAFPLALALLGLGSPSKADPITRNVNVTLNALNVESFDLDVDLDGVIDFKFTAALVPDPVLSVGFAVVDFPFGSNNGVVIDRPTFDGFPTASRLAAGDTVSSAATFSLASFDQGNLFFFTTLDPPSGNFGGQHGFVGLRFDRAGGTVFGFAEITVNDLNAPVNPLGLTIGTVGYDDVPGRAVVIPTAVPEPCSLVVLLLGLCGFAPVVWRHRRPGRANDALRL